MAQRAKGGDRKTVFRPWTPSVPRTDIAPSILSADFAAMGAELGKCRRARAPWIHIDVMDGHFVPNITFGPPLVKSWRAAEPGLFFDVHLMIDEPMEYAEAFRDAGADSITIHVEASKNPRRDLKALAKLGVGTGISLRPKTPTKAIRECLDLADIVLVMTVEPGFGGQPLIASTLNKVRELGLTRQSESLAYRLQVDGGINATTIPLAHAAGADVFVAGSAVFGGEGVAANVRNLREILAKNGSAPAKPVAKPRRAASARKSSE